MPCACQKGRKMFEVVANGGDGKVLFSSTDAKTAETVSKRYPGSVVRPPETAAAKALGEVEVKAPRAAPVPPVPPEA